MLINGIFIGISSHCPGDGGSEAQRAMSGDAVTGHTPLARLDVSEKAK
jgi:hypothetical protein